MGGNALKSHVAIRLTKHDYDRVAERCLNVLRALYPTGRFTAIEAYHDKSDFGDLDIALTAENYNPLQAATALGAVEVVRNSSVTSIGVLANPDAPRERAGEVFQVDLIQLNAEEFDYALGYFSFNDLGNLIGRTAHKAGLTHGHNGLWFYLREGDYLFRNILLTRDYAAALTFLGYDPERFAKGFNNLEEIFEYVAGSAFFNRDIFLLENRNAQSRVRDRKRKTYTEFLKWCEARPDLPAYQYPTEKRVWMPRIAEHFAHFQAEYDDAMAELERQRAVKARFNGQYVTELTGLQGKELGIFMKNFREAFEDVAAMHTYILQSSVDTLATRVKALAVTLQLVP